MTPDKFRKIVRRGLMAVPDGDIEKQVEEITRRFVYAMEEEAESGQSGALELAQTPKEITEIMAPSRNRQVLPSPPPADQPDTSGSPLVVLSGSPEAREAEKNTGSRVAPIRLDRNRQVSASTVRKFWTVDRLLTEIASSQDIPEKLYVQPNGSDGRIVLNRAIEQSAPLGVVKVTYMMEGMERAAPGGFKLMPNRETKVDPIALDTPVFATFSVYDADPNIKGKMDKLISDAKSVFQIRPSSIVSKTPMQSGPLRFDSSNPHADVDMDPSTGH